VIVETYNRYVAYREESVTLLQNKVADRKHDKKNRFLTIASEYLAGTKQKEEDEILPMSANKVEVSYDSVGHRLFAVKRRKRERTSYHKNLPAGLSIGRR